jgi:hypothetical protein
MLDDQLLVEIWLPEVHKAVFSHLQSFIFELCWINNRTQPKRSSEMFTFSLVILIIFSI